MKITQINKKRLGWLIALVVFFFLLSMGLIWGWMSLSQPSPSAEEQAIEFYKAAWVDGNAKNAAEFGAEEGAEQKISEDVESGENTPIRIAEYTSEGDSYRMFYMYRPSDNKMFAVQLTEHMGEWIVTRYDRQENYSQPMLDQALPQLQSEWKEVQP